MIMKTKTKKTYHADLFSIRGEDVFVVCSLFPARPIPPSPVQIKIIEGRKIAMKTTGGYYPPTPS